MKRDVIMGWSNVLVPPANLTTACCMVTRGAFTLYLGCILRFSCPRGSRWNARDLNVAEGLESSPGQASSGCILGASKRGRACIWLRFELASSCAVTGRVGVPNTHAGLATGGTLVLRKGGGCPNSLSAKRGSCPTLLVQRCDGRCCDTRRGRCRFPH